MTCHPLSSLRALIAAVGLASFAIGCGAGLPAVISSTPDKVAVEFEREGGLQDAAELARQECGKLGKSAEFDEVDITATPDTRIAKYNCVSPSAPSGDTD
jgi:hypothetical protein